MNKKQNTNLTLIQFMLRAQQIAQDRRSEKGYAMLMTSMITIAMFSMLAAYVTMTNLSKSSTNAYVDGTNTFYAAESGLNKRAEQLRQKFIGYAAPANRTATANPINVSTCFPLPLTTTNTANNDFECRNYPFDYNNNIAQVTTSDGSGATVISEQDNGRNKIRYTAYTFVSPKQDYTTTPPTRSTIPAGQLYAGLNTLEYLYTVYSTAAKPDPNNTSNPVQQSDGKTVLQMNFRSRIVPLFQFAVFYDGDLEMNSSSNMTIGGRVHTNANFYVQPYTTDTTITTTFLSPITAVGSIYNRVDASGTVSHPQSTFVLMAGTNCSVVGNCLPFPDFSSTNTYPLTSGQLAVFGNNVKSGSYDSALVRLDTPPPGFLRKRNYFEGKTTSNAGEYYSKADMRLEMVPDRDVTSTGTTPWARDTRRIPFNFTSVTSVKGTASSCTTALPGTDALASGIPAIAGNPAANYIDPERNNPGTSGTLLNNLHCNVFTKGQLQSLRQPVLVLATQSTTTLQTAEDTALGKPAIPTTGLPSLSTTVASTPATKTKILRALQVALASTPSPITLDILDKPFSDAVYTTAGTPGKIFLTEFTRLLNTIPTSTLPSSDVTNLTTGTRTPRGIANIQGAWFLPAPVQRIETSNNPDTATNVRSSGFYDGREQRWITMLQTNIASLSVWNRDSLYVEASDNTTDTLRRLPYVTTSALKNAAFNSGTGANFTDGLAFDRASTIPATPKGLQSFGLGSVDNTEGGLVFHATVSDDLNGDGTMNANDVSLDTASPIKKRDAVGALVGADNNPVTGTNPEVIIDYPRKYRGGSGYQSPFGFAFNGGDRLPAPLTLVTDQAIYVQGNFNNNGVAQATTTATIATNVADPNHLPASIIGDTISVLSNECLNNSATSASSTTNHLGVPVGQLRCGLPRAATGSVNVTVGGSTATYYAVTGPTAVNAAFLSNTNRSIGNLGVGRGFGGATFSGALNNYMRMLEDWGGGAQFFNYTGSFVSLGTPLEFSGQYFGGGTYYNIPRRNFNFDTTFNNFTSLPPLPPRAIYLQQDVFKRTYN